MTAPHVVVIGAGMGGLAAALDLLSSGARVTLLERQARPGGKMREVTVAGQPIDSGPTVMTMRWVFDDLFARAGLKFSEHVELNNSDLLARHSWLDGSRLDLFADSGRSRDAITEFAGVGEARAYDRFVAKSAKTFDTLDLSFMRASRPNAMQLGLRVGLRGLPGLMAANPFVSLWKELSKIFSDPRLVQLFGRYSTYCGSSPFLAPSTLMLIAEAERRGVWLVGGGMQRVANALAAAVASAGGEVRCEAEVAAIDVRSGRIAGVTLKDGEQLAADAVVFNGDSQALAEGLLGQGVVPGAKPRTEQGYTLSAITLSAVGRPEGFPLGYHTVFFGDDYVDEFEAVFQRGEICARPTVYICAQDRADHQAPESGIERLFCLINAPPKALSEDVVARHVTSLRDHLAQHGLTLTVEEDAQVVTSPAEFGLRFPGSRGGLYGRPTHGPWGSFTRPGSATPVAGLFLAGGSVHPGAGIPMAAQSGRLAAAEAAISLGLG
ncbi:MAG: 1-hydroxycarotenoid 3,4-desaturase CrtD [Pseudomonadota bacterium]